MESALIKTAKARIHRQQTKIAGTNFDTCIFETILVVCAASLYRYTPIPPIERTFNKADATPIVPTVRNLLKISS